MKVSHNRFHCEPFEYSNDRWSVITAEEVRKHLSKTDRTQAALVIGAGTLPYTLDILPETIYVSDLSNGVLEGVRHRASQLVLSSSSWKDFENGLAPAGKDELAGALESGLAGSFEEVKRKSSIVDIIPVLGDIVVTAPKVAEQLRASSQTLTFVNFTNIARYLGMPTINPRHRSRIPNGRSVLVEVLKKLPLSEGALVCDSYESLRVQAFPAQDYIETFGSI